MASESNNITAAIALTILALVLTNISLTSVNHRILLHTLKDYINRIAIESNDTEFEGSNCTKLDVVRAFMKLAQVAFANAIVTGLWLAYHLDNEAFKMKMVAMGCVIFATMCLLIAVAVYMYAQFATDLEVIGEASFGHVIVAMVMSLAAAACFRVAKPTSTANDDE